MPPAERGGEATDGSVSNLGDESLQNLMALDNMRGEPIEDRDLCENGAGKDAARGSAEAGDTGGSGGHAAMPIARALREAGMPAAEAAGSGGLTAMPPAVPSGWGNPPATEAVGSGGPAAMPPAAPRGETTHRRRRLSGVAAQPPRPSRLMYRLSRSSPRY